MKTIALIIGTIFIAMAALATPVAIGLGLYDWAGNDMAFKHAAWEGFKSWICMLGLGLLVGLPCYELSK